MLGNFQNLYSILLPRTESELIFSPKQVD